MKWLNLNLIKAQIRMEPDFTLEDDLLTMYGESAEKTVLDVIQRDYTEVMEKWGETPKPLVHASLLLVAQSYQNRETVSMQNMYTVPYAFDMMVKPYMKLTSDSYGQNNNNEYGNKHCNL
jgi:uncharacterized phage protein (predicted DNA packaging)